MSGDLSSARRGKPIFFFTYKKQPDKAGTGKTEVNYEGLQGSTVVILQFFLSDFPTLI